MAFSDVYHQLSLLMRALLGRWPSKGRFRLAMQELNTRGLFSVNGPQGTGKTTLLRDVRDENHLKVVLLHYVHCRHRP
ncbi:MAG: hypothetical protein JKY88_07735 [Pseudomonadales bacterium]|nr:hypothetical protein [Pseudomonadales bacterium]